MVSYNLFKAISKAPGIGAKTAQRVVVELKDTLSKFDIADIPSVNHNKNKEVLK